MTPDQEKKLHKMLDAIESPEVSILELDQKIDDTKTELQSEITAIDSKVEQALSIAETTQKTIIKGEDGHTPTTDELVSLIKPLIPEPIKGDKGDTVTVEKVIERTEVIKEVPIVTENVVEKAVTDLPEVTARKLETLKDEKRLDASAIKNLPQPVVQNIYRGGSGIKKINAGVNISIIDTGNGEITLSSPNDTTATWGSITGTLSNQTDLQNALNALVPYSGATSDVDLGAFSLTASNLSGNNTGDQDLSGLVPYSGATSDVDLGAYTLTAEHLKTTDDLEVTDDILLGSGSVLNWNSGDITLTHSANTLTFAGMDSLDLGTSALTSQEHIITTPDAETEGSKITGSSQTYTPTGVQPNTIANLVRWFKADAITGLNDGDAVTTWTTSAGSGNATGSGTTRPIYKTNVLNGKPAVRFDGTDDILKIATAFQPETVFIVFNYTDGATFTSYDGLFTDQGLTVGTGLIGNNATNDFYTAGGYFNELRLNGAVTTGDLGTLSTHKIITGRKLYSSPQNVTWQFGQDRTIAGRFWGGDILEFIAYSRKLKSSEVREVEKYLSDKYGIAVTNSSYDFEDNFVEYYIGSTLQARIDKLGLHGNQAGVGVTLGGLPNSPGTYGGVWLGQSYPDVQNYLLLGSNATGQSIINAPSTGTYTTGELRRGNANIATWGQHGFAIGIGENTIPESTRTFTIVNKSATKIGQIIKGFTAQSANLEEWHDVSNNVLASVNASGGFTTTNNLSIDSDSGSLILGDGQDGKLIHNGSGIILQSDVVTAGDYLQLRGGTNGIDFNIGATEQMTLTDGVLAPTTDNDIDLGIGGSKEYKDIHAKTVRAKHYAADDTAPVADGTYNFDGSAAGTVSAFTIKDGIITSITTR